MHRLAVVAIFKDEARYLAEWVRFHRSMGVERFYLYDNESADHAPNVLRMLSAERSDLTIVHAPGHRQQLPAYNHAHRTFGHENHWMAFLDIDEFLFDTTGNDLRTKLDEFDGESAVCVNWVNFGSSRREEASSEPVVRTFLQRGNFDVVVRYPHLLRSPNLNPQRDSSYRPLNAHIKSIVRPTAVSHCRNPHFWEIRSGFAPAVNEARTTVDGPFSEPVSVNNLRINHYWSKSRSEMREKLYRGRSDNGHTRSWEEFLLRDRAMNEVFDDLAVRVWAKRRLITGAA